MCVCLCVYVCVCVFVCSSFVKAIGDILQAEIDVAYRKINSC